MRDRDVRRDVPGDVQERAELAPGPGPRLREHPHRAVRQQGRHQGPQGQGQVHRVPPQEEPPVLRHLGQVKLQLREAFLVDSCVVVECFLQFTGGA